MDSETYKDWLKNHGYGDVVSVIALDGGSISRVSQVSTSEDAHFVVKEHADPPKGFFQAEANGLNALRSADALKTPDVYVATDRFILLEYLEPATVNSSYWSSLANGLASLHKNCASQHGFDSDNFCGLTPQDNTPTADGHSFFANRRLLPLGAKAVKSGELPKSDFVQLEKLTRKLGDIIPDKPACLIHGDLWSGNIHCYQTADANSTPQPAVIDPAAYWGWAEAELAMTKLFGGFPPSFYATYLENHPFEPDWEDRIDIYNLYHLLNHLTLFGGSYYHQVKAVLNKYCGST